MVWWGATGARGDEGGVAAGQAGHTVDPRRLDGLSQHHIWQDSSETARQHGLARPRTAQHQDIMVRTPALPSRLMCSHRARYGIMAR
jgi:hypothetical protein